MSCNWHAASATVALAESHFLPRESQALAFQAWLVTLACHCCQVGFPNLKPAGPRPETRQAVHNLTVVSFFPELERTGPPVGGRQHSPTRSRAARAAGAGGARDDRTDDDEALQTARRVMA